MGTVERQIGRFGSYKLSVSPTGDRYLAADRDFQVQTGR